jgi:hypothetical protein
MPLDYSFYNERKLERLSRSKTILFEQCEMIYKLQNDMLLEGLAMNPYTDARILERIYNDLKTDSYEHRLVIEPLMINPSLPYSIKEEAAASSDLYISNWIALNAALDASLIKTLRARNEKSIYINLCGNHYLSPNVLRELYYELKNEHKDLIPMFCNNTGTPHDVLSQIIEDDVYHSNGLNALISNVSLTPDLIDKLLVKRPLKGLTRIARYASAPIVEVFYNSFLKEKGMSKETQRLWMHILRNKNTSPNILEEMYHSGESVFTPDLLSVNPSTPIPILEELAKTNDRDVLNGLAMNSSTPEKILLEMDWAKLARVPLGRLANSTYATAEKIKATLNAIDKNSELELEENLMQAPLAQMEDILHALKMTNGFKEASIAYLFDREEILYSRLVKFMESNYGVDIINLPDTMVLELLNIDF